MQKICRFCLISASLFGLAWVGSAQDAPPSLGDVARQARQQKQQKDAQANKDGQQANPSDTQTPSALAKGLPDKTAAGPTVLAQDKQQLKTAKKIVTNDEIPEHIGPTSTRPAGAQTSTVDYTQPDYGQRKAPAEFWQSRIQAQKNAIASLKSDVTSISASIQYAGANCVSNYVQCHERQQQKQQQVEALKMQLEDMQKQLEAMQDAARKQGYGTSVYDP
jgi:hypothetical protein